MKIKKNKPRFFQVGKKKNKIFISDKYKIYGKNDDAVNFNNKIEIIFKEWGYIIDNKINKNKNYKFVFAGVKKNKIHLLMFFLKKIKSFKEYCKNEDLKIIPINKICEK